MPRAQPPMQARNNETFRQAPQLTPCRFSAHTQSVSPTYPQGDSFSLMYTLQLFTVKDYLFGSSFLFHNLIYTVPGPGLVSHGYRSDSRSDSFNYSRRVFGSELDSIRGYEAHFRRAGEHPIPYPSYR